MPPDERIDQVPSERPSLGAEWDGPWGSIAPVPHSIETLCIRIEKEAGNPCIFYYPYRTIGHWNWSMDANETLEIKAASVQVVISGSGLRRLAEALNMGQLRLVQSSPIPGGEEEIIIRSILIEEG